MEPSSQPESESLQSANYLFTPPSEATPGETGVTFLQITPNFVSEFAYPDIPPFQGFAREIDSDMQELLSARGYSVRGSFENQDVVVYSDREQSDFFLLTSLELNADASKVGAREKISLSSLVNGDENNFSFVGEILLEGQIRLVAIETLTGERLWVKSVDLPGQTVAIDGQETFGKDELAVAIQQDPGIRNPLTKALEEYHKTFMETAWAYFDPNEMAVLKEQADKLKDRKRY